MTLAIEIRGFAKTYRIGLRQRAAAPSLVGLDLEVPPGEVFGYLGPNGSGKTTTLKLLFGLVKPDAGQANVLGHPFQSPEWRARVGYLPEHPYLYDYLTPREYLDYAARLFGLDGATRRERSAALLARVGLERSADVPMRRFSKGMVQRAGLAQALVNDPDLVVLDEPMSGLDPLGRRLVRDVILDLKQRGKTVFFSTHILSDAETLCDRVALLRGGRLVNVGRLDEILRIDVAHMEVLVSGIDEAVLRGLEGPVSRRQAMGERWRLEVAESDLLPVLQAVGARGGRVLSVQPVRQSLEDYFFKELAQAPGGGAWSAED